MKKVYEAPEGEVVLFEGQFAEVIYSSEVETTTSGSGSDSGTNE